MINIFNNSLGKSGVFGGSSMSPDTLNGALFDVFGADSGYFQIPSAMNVSGIPGTITLRLEGHQATTSLWTPAVGATNFAIQGSGAGVSTGELLPTTKSTESAVLFNTAKYFSASSYEITSGDVVFEFYFKYNLTGATQTLAAQYNEATSKGVKFTISSAGVLAGIGLAALTPIATLEDRSHYHLMVFCDPDGTNRYFLNGTLVASAANGGTDQTAGVGVAIGANSAGTAPFSGSIAFFQVTKFPTGTFSTLSPQQSVVTERFAKLAGVYPNLSMGDPLPTFVRASSAFIDRPVDESNGIRRIFRVGTGWPRICRRPSGGSWFNGYLSEDVGGNRLLQSENFASSSWSKLNCTISSGISGPGGNSAYSVTPNTGTATHTVQQTIAGGADYVTCWAKKGANDYFGIRLNGGGTDFAIFNLANGTVATSSGAVNATIIPYGDGWYLCGAGPAGGTNQIYLVTTNSPTSLSYNQTTSGVIGTYIYGACATNNVRRAAQSYVYTTTTSASRPADRIFFNSSNNYAPDLGSVEIDVLIPVETYGSVVISEAFSTSSNLHRMTVAATTGILAATVISGGTTVVSGSGTTALRTQTKKSIIASYSKDNYKIGSSAAELTDTSVTMPQASQIYLGCANAVSLALGGLILSFKTYRRRSSVF